MEVCRLDGWSVIVLHRKCQATHLATHGVAKPSARFVLVSEVYMRGMVSASGIRFFSGGEKKLAGKRTEESRRGRGDLCEVAVHGLLLQHV